MSAENKPVKTTDKVQFSSVEKVLAALEKGGIDISDTQLKPEKIQLVKQLTGDDKGSFGNVWQGRCFESNVAVKVPKTQELSEKELRDLMKEIAIWKSLPHPNIVLFMGACTDPGKVMIVVELMNGDLSDLIKQRSLTMLDLLDFARQAALGMSWLHNNAKIIHRDLKPANIMYVTMGQAYRIKVGDFGLASVKRKKDKIAEIAGSPLYSAPEVLQGKEYSFPVDVYSFGICLWEICTKGKLQPFYDLQHGGDFEKFKELVIEGERPEIEDVRNVEGLRDLITNCWDPDPKKRPTFSQIVHILQDIQVNAAIRDSLGKVFWKEAFGDAKGNAIKVNNFIKKLYKFIENSVDLEAIIEHVDETEKRNRDPSKKYSQLIGGLMDFNAPTNSHFEPLVADHPPNQAFYEYRCLVELFAPVSGSTIPYTKDRVVTITTFGKILDWFGPLEKNRGSKNGFLSRVRNTLKLTYFHGLISNEEASRRLVNLPPGTFLVRFSSSAGFYVLSRRIGNNFVEGRILFVPGRGFTVDHRVFFSTLKKFISFHRQELDLNTMCGGSEYKKLFNPVYPEPPKKKKKRKKKKRG